MPASAEIPDGVYEAESFLDDDALGDEPVPIKVKVTVEGEELTVDFTGLAEQVPGPLNSGVFWRRHDGGTGGVQIFDCTARARQ